MHDRVFEATSLDDHVLTTLASSVGIVAAEFDACVHDKDVLAKVIGDREDGRGFGFASTPSFFLGRMLPTGTVKVERVLAGAKPIGDFRAAVDALLE
jgi:predicted DsbA family dithiol-disulfide isomerase